jgi:ADP-heptose:LPS heptosyltransferase
MFLKEEQVRSWLAKKLPRNEEWVRFDKQLQNYGKILVILPDQDEQIFALMPFLLFLRAQHGQEGLSILMPHQHRHLCESLQLRDCTLLYPQEHLRYGTKTFAKVSEIITGFQAELCLFLDSHFSALKLYLAALSGAPARLGVGKEDEYPFLNVVLRQKEEDIANPYNICHTLCRHFNLEQENTLELARKSHRPRKQENSRAQLKVLLLNLEEEIWSEEELREVQQQFSKKFHLLAVQGYSTASQGEKQALILKKLGIPSSPLVSTSRAFLDLLWQYHALLTHNTAHMHLAANLSEIPIICKQEEGDTRFLPPNRQNLHLCHNWNEISPAKT